MGYPSSSKPHPTGFNLSSATKIPSFARVIARYVFLVYVAMLYMNYPRCGDCAFSASLVRECTDVSYVAGEGVEFTVHKESVVIEEIKEVELSSRRAQLIYDRNYNRIGLQLSGHAPSRLPVKKVRRLLHKRRKVRVFVWRGIRKNITFLLFLCIHN